jgi:NAD(P)-dependent dehydrogenase (short-subunit alcohol dehydrogenase family)
VISPGGTATPRVVDAMSARGALPDLDTPRIPPLGQPEDIANAAVYLASDEARMVTGIVLPVDGGGTSVRLAPRRPS